jgi:hypothetical protein
LEVTNNANANVIDLKVFDSSASFPLGSKFTGLSPPIPVVKFGPIVTSSPKFCPFNF